MRLESLYDKINFYEIFALIGEYCNINRKEIITKLFLDTGICTETDLDTIEKYMTRDVPGITQPLEDMRNQFESEKDRENFLKKMRCGCEWLAEEIRKPREAQNIYENLFKSCNNINFSEKQYEEIEKLYNKIISSGISDMKLEREFLLYMVVHAIRNYDISSPKFYCNRLHQESLTLTYGSEMQKRILKEIVEISINSNTKSTISAEAASRYANLIYDENTEEAYKYFLIASEKLPSAYWEIAYLIEYHRLKTDKIEDFDKKLNNKIKEYNKKQSTKIKKDTENKKSGQDNIGFSTIYEIDSENDRYILIITTQDARENIIEKRKFLFDSGSKEKNYDYLISFKTYFFIAQKLNFSKGWNSVGKYLLEKKTVLLTDGGEIDGTGSVILMKKYFGKALALGNVNAMVNLGLFYYQKFKNNDLTAEEKDIMLNMLENAADTFSEPKASELLGNYYYKSGKSGIAEKYYKMVLDINKINKSKNKYAHYMLGKIYKDKRDYDAALNELQIAISYGCYDAAYDCAIIWFEKAVSCGDENRKSINLYLCKEYCERYVNLVNDDVKAKIIEIQKLIREEI